MDVSKKLAQWEQAELIDAQTRGRIEAHEGAHRSPIMLYAMLGLGGFTVGLGIISVVAANWEEIPDRMKLVVDLVLAAILAAATYQSSGRGKTLATDALVVVYYIFTLASISLVGQVYQLTAPTYQALLLWSAVTAPLVWLGHSRWLGVLWCAGLTWTYGLSMEALLDDVHGVVESNLAVVLVGGFLLAAFAANRGWVLPRKPQLSMGIQGGLQLLLLLAAFVSTAPWYERIDADELLSWGLLAVGLMGVGAHRMLDWMLPDCPPRARHGIAGFVAISWVSLAASMTLEHASIEALGGIFQLALLCALAWTAVQLGRVRMFNALTGLIAVRILIIYFEVFGSMLDTGIGMITGGMLTLLMAWLWRRKSPQLARQLGAEAS